MNNYDIKFLLKKLSHVSNTPAYPENSSDAPALLIFQELCRLCGTASVKSRAFVTKIAEYIRMNIRKNITVSHIAEHFGYNPDYIGRLFKRNFNTGLKDYNTHMNNK